MGFSRKPFIYLSAVLLFLGFTACGGKKEVGDSQDLPDLNEQIRPYVTVENTKVRTGPGIQFRAIAEIPRDAKVNVVGRDGEWLLIISKKGNAPGFIEMAAAQPGTGKDTEESAPTVKGKFQTLADTQVRTGPGSDFPVVANIPKGIKINVVGEENGWLKVESKQGNKPGYVDAKLARPVTTE
jgi:uncharacterized protein YgiM (DUF1202 family)